MLLDAARPIGHLPQAREPREGRELLLLAAYDRHVSSLALAVREMVLEEAPAAVESIVKSYAVVVGFSFTGKPLKDGFCHVVTYSSYVNLGFNRGALLPDPGRVLKGTGKMIRHIRLEKESDLERLYLRRYIQAAIESVGEGEEKKPTRNIDLGILRKKAKSSHGCRNPRATRSVGPSNTALTIVCGSFLRAAQRASWS